MRDFCNDFHKRVKTLGNISKDEDYGFSFFS